MVLFCQSYGIAIDNATAYDHAVSVTICGRRKVFEVRVEGRRLHKFRFTTLQARESHTGVNFVLHTLVSQFIIRCCFHEDELKYLRYELRRERIAMVA